MTKRTVKDLDVAGKKVIVRCDFNVPRKDGVITDDNRIVMALPTIKYLVENKAKVILMSHLGKVKTEEDKAKNNLECVAVRLQELLPDVKVTFCPVTRGEELENAVNALADGEIVLMQNTRYEKGESKNDPELGAYWASLGEVFVEDAFGSVHRAHASTVGIPTNIKENGLGFLVEKEVTMLGKAVDEPAHPFVAIIGGSKVSSKIDVVDNLLKKADKVIIGGGMAYTFSKAVGGSIGTSLVEDDKLDLAKEYLEKALESMINKNCTRIKFSERFKSIIDRYNAGGTETEEYYNQLVKFVEELQKEQERAKIEDLTEEELEMYDLLVNGKKLTKAEEQSVKLAAKNLYKKLTSERDELLVVDWYKDEQPKLKVKSAIETSLNNDLPESYDKEIFNSKINLLLNHFIDMAVQAYGWIANKVA